MDVSSLPIEMIQVALKAVKRAQRRWMDQINHHLEESQFLQMNLMFRQSVRNREWNDLSPEMQEAISTAAAGKSQSLAFVCAVELV